MTADAVEAAKEKAGELVEEAREMTSGGEGAEAEVEAEAETTTQ